MRVWCVHMFGCECFCVLAIVRASVVLVRMFMRVRVSCFVFVNGIRKQRHFLKGNLQSDATISTKSAQLLDLRCRGQIFENFQLSELLSVSK